MPAERHAGMMQLRFRRAGHDPQHVGDLFVTIPFDIVQYEHLSRAVGQPPDRFLEIHRQLRCRRATRHVVENVGRVDMAAALRSEEHTSELQSRLHLVCRLLLEKKKNTYYMS